MRIIVLKTRAYLPVVNLFGRPVEQLIVRVWRG
jgi:hypothetical protein